MADAVERAIHVLDGDSLGYQRSMDEAARAGQRLVDSAGKVETSTERLGKAHKSAADQVSGLERRLEPLIRAEQQRTRDMALLNRAYREGDILVGRYTENVRRVESAYQRAAERSKALTTAANDNVSAFSGFSGVLGRVNTLLGGFGVAISAVALIAFARNTINTIGGLGELADQVGLTTDQLQAYQFAAAQSGVSAEQLQGGISRLTRTIGDAARGEDAAIITFRRAGVGILDFAGNVRTTDEVLGDIAERIKAASTEAERGAIAYDIFGKSGQRLIPMLKDGREGLERWREEAIKAGDVASRELIDRFDKMADRLAVVGMRMTIWFGETLDSLLTKLQDPKYKALAAVLGGAAAGGFLAGPLGAAAGAGVGLGMTITDLFPDKEIEEAAARVERLRVEMEKLTATYLDAQAAGAGGGMFALLGGQLAAKQKEFTVAFQALQIARQPGGPGNLGGGGGSPELGFGAGGPGGGSGAGTGQMLTVAAKAIAELNDEGSKLRELTDALDKGDVAIQRVTDHYAALVAVRKLGKDASDDERKSVYNLTRDNAELARSYELVTAARKQDIAIIDKYVDAFDRQEEADRKRTESFNASRDSFKQGLDDQIKDNEQLATAAEKTTIVYNQLTGAFELNTNELIRRRAILEAERKGLDPEEAKRYADELVRQSERIKAINDGQQRALERQQATFNELANFADRAFDRIGSAITEAFVQGKDAAINFGSIAKGVMSELLQEMLKLAILNPLKNNLFGQNNPTLGNVTSMLSGGSTSGISGGGFNPLSMFSGGGGTGGSTFGGIGDIFGGLFGSAAGPSTAAAATSSAIGPGGLLAGGGATSLAGGASGGLSAGLSGAMAAIPVWGWIALAASTAKKFTTGKDPKSVMGGLNTFLLPSIDEWMQNPVRSFGNVIDPMGTFLADHLGEDNPLRYLSPGGLFAFAEGDVPKPYASAGGVLTRGKFNMTQTTQLDDMPLEGVTGSVQSIANALQSLSEAGGGRLVGDLHLLAATGKEAGGFSLAARAFGGSGWNTDTNQVAPFMPGSPEQLTLAVFKQLVNIGAVSGLSPSAKQVALTSTSTDLNEFAKDIDLAQLLSAGSVAARELTKNFEALNDQFGDMSSRAQRLGLDLSVVQKMQTEQFDALIGQELDSRYGGLSALVDSLKIGAGSALSPQSQLDEAQRQFDELFAKSQSGDAGALSGLGQAGRNLIDLGRDYFATTDPFAKIYESVLSKTQEILGAAQSSDPIVKIIAESGAMGRASTEKYFTALIEEVRQLRAEVRRGNDTPSIGAQI
jgi:hypothetical protein